MRWNQRHYQTRPLPATNRLSLAEAIRSHPDEKDLFRTLVNELHEVVEFDVLCQFDGTANWVQWYFAEPYNDKLEARRLEAVPKEETAAWWVYQNQEPVVVRLTDQKTRCLCSIGSRNWV